jgi:hypothetical protein
MSFVLFTSGTGLLGCQIVIRLLEKHRMAR